MSTSVECRCSIDLPLSPARVLHLQSVVKIAGLGAVGLGGAFVIGGLQTLGNSLSPFPVPRDDGDLVTDGAFSYTRHPMYTGTVPFEGILHS